KDTTALPSIAPGQLAIIPITLGEMTAGSYRIESELVAQSGYLASPIRQRHVDKVIVWPEYCFKGATVAGDGETASVSLVLRNGRLYQGGGRISCLLNPSNGIQFTM